MDSNKQMRKQQNLSLTQEDESLQKKRRRSFSPMKSLKILQYNTHKKDQMDILPVMISSYTPEQKQQSKPLATTQQNPITYLLQYQTSKGSLIMNKRSQQEISLIMKFIQGNKIWSDLGFCDQDTISMSFNSNKNNDQMMKDICNSIVLVWSEIPNITETKSNEVYLILEGKTFEYIHNENAAIKLKIHENNDYIMIRKLGHNDYFLSLPQGKFKSKPYQNISEKYQLMVDEKTLMAKISDQLFSKYIQKRLTQRIRDLTTFMKRIILFENLPEIVFQELSKFIKLKRVDKDIQIIKEKQKSKEIFFIKKGEVEFKVHNESSDNGSNPTQKIQILQEFDVFGMDTLHTIKKVDSNLQFSAKSLTDCQLYCIDKRILAIVISSFEKDFKVKQKIVKPININAQIKGQNYISKKQQLLNENAQRIKTSQKKIRDVKLLNFSKNKQRQVNTYIPEKDRVKEKKVQTKQNQTKLRSSAGFKMMRSKSLKSQGSLSNIRESNQSNFWTLRKSLSYKYEQHDKQHQGMAYNQMVLPVMQEEDIARKTLTVYSNSSYNQFQKIHKKSLKVFSPALETNYQKTKNQFSSTVRSFIPKVQSRASIYETASNSIKIESQLIKNYIEKKIKQEVVKKAQDIIDMKNSSQRSSIKNIKKFYTKDSFSPSKKVSQVVRVEKMTRKQLTDELFDRMANIKESPLLSLIETQRKKMQSTSKSKIKFQKQVKIQEQKSKEKINARFNNQPKNLFLNSQRSSIRQFSSNERTHPISSLDSKHNTTQN